MKYFPEFKDDVEFAKQLIVEQGVTCLPGSVSVACLSAKYYAAHFVTSLSLSFISTFLDFWLPRCLSHCSHHAQ